MPGRDLKNSRFALVALSTVPALIVFLVALWLYSYKTIPPLPVRYEGGNLLAFDSERGFVARPDSHVRWVSENPEQNFDIFTDSRSGRTDRAKPAPSQADILIVGCSQSWGPFVQYEQTFAGKLGPNVENLAMASYGTVQSFQALKLNLDLRPKLVVYGFISDHLRRNVMPCAPSYYPFCLDVSHVEFDPISIAPPRGDGVSRANRHIDGPGFTNWLPHGIEIAIARYRKAWSDSHVPKQEYQRAALTYVLNEMSATSRSIGANLVILNIPGPNEIAMNESLREAASALGIMVIDATPAFLKSQKKNELYVPDGHLSAAGHTVIAEVLRPYLPAATDPQRQR